MFLKAVIPSKHSQPGRCGPVQQLRLEQGTNFISAMSELQQAISELGHKKIRQELLKTDCHWIDFKMHMPHTNHMDGSWERHIWKTRNILTALLNGRLRTCMVEVEAIVNCRQLTIHNINSPQPLTPNHVHTKRSSCLHQVSSCVPTCIQGSGGTVFSTSSTNSGPIKKMVYLQSLQLRQKWVSPKRILQVDDIV